MQPRERPRVDGVAAWPAPNLQRATGADRGEAMTMCGRVIPGEDPRVQGEKMRGAGAAGGGTPGIEGLQLSNETGGDEAGARPAQCFMEFLRRSRRGRGARPGRRPHRSKGDDFVVLTGDAKPAAMLQAEHGSALGWVDADLNHGFGSVAVRGDGRYRGAPRWRPHDGEKRKLGSFAFHLPECADQPVELVPLRSLRDEEM